jgi:hypothetical protein
MDAPRRISPACVALVRANKVSSARYDFICRRPLP